MNDALITLALFLIIYWKVKNQYTVRLNCKFKYKLYDLRDALRTTAIEKKTSCEDWQFKYLDTSISKIVNDLDTLNVFIALVLYNRYKDDKYFEAHKIALEKGISENKYYSVIYKEYGLLISDYVFQKHFIIRRIFLIPSKLKSAIKQQSIRKKIITWFQMLISSFRIAPETSTSYSFVSLN